jgi:sugar lactone lactonase YvrE
MRAIALLGILTLASGCASNAGASSATGALPNAAALPEHGALLYAGGPNLNDVDLYRASGHNPKPLRHIINGLDAPTGMTVDSAGDLYVCNNAGQSVPGKSVFWTVTVYHYRQGYPYKTYTNGVFSPVDVAVGGDGTVYIANYSSSVTVYTRGSVDPSQSLQGPSGYAPLGVALDAKGRLYVSYVALSGVGGRIYRYAPGKTTGKDLGISFAGNPHGIAVDAAGNLIVAVSTAPSPGSSIEVFAPGKTHPKETLSGPFQPFMVALSPDNGKLFVADYASGNNDGGVFVYDYSAGTLLYEDKQGAAAGAYGVAVSN